MYLRNPPSICRVLLLLIAVAGVALVSGCSSQAKLATPARPAIVAQPESAAAQNIATYSGEVRARYESALGFRIAGKVQKRLVDTGARVKKDQVLAVLEAQDSELAVASARAALASAQADWSLAQSEYERYRSMFDKKLISQSQLDAKLNVQKASAARVDQARAGLSVSQNQSSYTNLRADHDGVITQVMAEPGQVVAAGQPVVGLAQEGEREILINVPESRISSFKPGLPVVVEIWAEQNAKYTGSIREVSPEADRTTRTFNVRVAIKDASSKIQLGMTSRVYLDNESVAADALLVPLSALAEREGKPALWVLDAKSRQVHLAPVTVGGYSERGVTVLSGLAAESWVVTAGVHKLVEGQTVRPIDRDNNGVTL